MAERRGAVPEASGEAAADDRDGLGIVGQKRTSLAELYAKRGEVIGRDLATKQIDRRAWRAQPEEIARLESYAHMSLSVVWAVYAAIILTVGFLRQNRPLRWTALGIFGVTLLKVVFVDMAGLAGYYRVGAFFVLSVMMALGAWIYQRIQFTQSGGEAEGVRS